MIGPFTTRNSSHSSVYSPMDKRFISFSGVGCFAFLIQFLTTFFSVRALPDMYSFSLQLVFSMLGWATIAWALPSLFPYRPLRKAIAVVEILIISILYLTDTYLLNAYQTPYTDSMAGPILATNPEEIRGFFNSSTGTSETYFWYIAAWILVGAFSLFFPYLLKHLLSLPIKRIGATTIKLLKKLPLLPALVILMLWCGIIHSKKAYNMYKSDWVWYNSMVMPERLYTSYKMAKKEWFFYTQQMIHSPQNSEAICLNQSLPLHNVVVVLADNLYPALMHCYGHYLKNTPTIDTLTQRGEALLFYNVVGDPTASPTEAVRNMLSLATNKELWDRQETLTHRLKKAGYTTYWLSNQNKAEPWLKFIPALASECDSSFYCNLRGSEEYWSSQPCYDEAVLKHLSSFAREGCGRKNLLQYVHLSGARESIWARVPERFNDFKGYDIRDNFLSSDESDNYAHYSNVILYMDYLIGEVIQQYSQIPSIILFIGPTGCQGNSHPYSKKNVAPSELNRVAFLCYISPSLQQQCPALSNKLHHLMKQDRLELNSFSEWLLSLLID